MFRLSSGKSHRNDCWPIGPARIALAVAAALLGGALPGFAQQPGLSQGEIHNPFSPRYNALLPAGRGLSTTPVAQHQGHSGGGHGGGGGHRHHGHHHGHHGHWGGQRSWFGGTNLTVIGPGYYSSFGVGSYVPGYFPGYYPGYAGGWYAPAYGYGAGFRYGYGAPYYPYPYVLPPVQIPAGVLYGPRAVWNMMLGPDLAGFGAGVGAGNLLAPIAPAAVAPQGQLQPGAVGNVPDRLPLDLGEQPPIKLKKVNEAARGRAMRLVALADDDFRAQKYAEASQRYRRAVLAAPDLAEAHFRRAQAEIALSRYDSAAKSCKRGLEVDPGWIAAGFRLANLYGPNQAAKTAHIEKLAQEAAANPQDTDLRFLIGIELYLDGQLERSRKFFEQAAALNRGDDAHLLAFLRELDRRVPVPREAAVDL